MQVVDPMNSIRADPTVLPAPERENQDEVMVFRMALPGAEEAAREQMGIAVQLREEVFDAQREAATCFKPFWPNSTGTNSASVGERCSKGGQVQGVCSLQQRTDLSSFGSRQRISSSVNQRGRRSVQCHRHGCFRLQKNKKQTKQNQQNKQTNKQHKQTTCRFGKTEFENQF